MQMFSVNSSEFTHRPKKYRLYFSAGWVQSSPLPLAFPFATNQPVTAKWDCTCVNHNSALKQQPLQNPHFTPHLWCESEEELREVRGWNDLCCCRLTPRWPSARYRLVPLIRRQEGESSGATPKKIEKPSSLIIRVGFGPARFSSLLRIIYGKQSFGTGDADPSRELTPRPRETGKDKGVRRTRAEGGMGGG